MSQNFTVVARSDGRGGIKPFNTYTGEQAGAKVWIGNESFAVGKDGRVNIPKRVMDSYGRPNKDGRMVVNIKFGTKPSTKDSLWWKNVYTEVKKPLKTNTNKKTGEIARKQDVSTRRKTLKATNVSDRTWNTNE